MVDEVEPTVKRRPGRPRTKFAEERERIIGTASRLFAERGYHATSISDICKEAGIGRGVLYHYIESKEDLLVAIHERFIGPALQVTRETARSNFPPDIILKRLGDAMVRNIAEHRDDVVVFVREWRTVAKDGARWDDVRSKRNEFADIIRDTIRMGQEQAIFRTLDLPLTALAFIGMYAYAYEWIRPDGRATPQEIGDLFGDIFLNGMRMAVQQDVGAPSEGEGSARP